jgi:hypothetical protein
MHGPINVKLCQGLFHKIYVLLKNNTIVYGFSQTQQYILFYCYLDEVFRSTGHHQTSLQNL